jgi:hypothetical protein
MEPFEKLKDRLDDALDQIESSLETKLNDTEDDGSLESLITENSDLRRQIDVLNDDLKNSIKDGKEQKDFHSLTKELVNLRAEREEEKKELQSLYNQLSDALDACGEVA